CSTSSTPTAACTRSSSGSTTCTRCRFPRAARGSPRSAGTGTRRTSTSSSASSTSPTSTRTRGRSSTSPGAPPAARPATSGPGAPPGGPRRAAARGGKGLRVLGGGSYPEGPPLANRLGFQVVRALAMNAGFARRKRPVDADLRQYVEAYERDGAFAIEDFLPA